MPDEIPAIFESEVLNLATANLLCSVAFTGVIALQAARWWAERADSEDEVNEVVETEDLKQSHPTRKLKKGGKATLNFAEVEGDARS